MNEKLQIQKIEIPSSFKYAASHVDLAAEISYLINFEFSFNNFTNRFWVPDIKLILKVAVLTYIVTFLLRPQLSEAK